MGKMQTRDEMLKALRAKMAERTKGRRDPDEIQAAEGQGWREA
jgi:hypothetical protein